MAKESDTESGRWERGSETIAKRKIRTELVQGQRSSYAVSLEGVRKLLDSNYSRETGVE